MKFVKVILAALSFVTVSGIAQAKAKAHTPKLAGNYQVKTCGASEGLYFGGGEILVGANYALSIDGAGLSLTRSLSDEEVEAGVEEEILSEEKPGVEESVNESTLLRIENSYDAKMGRFVMKQWFTERPDVDFTIDDLLESQQAVISTIQATAKGIVLSTQGFFGHESCVLIRK